MPPVPHSPAAEAKDHAALVVALDAGDLAGVDLQAATSLAASCAGCAALVNDLAAIRGALTALPVPPRRRDHRLTAEDAVRLRPTGWRRLLEWLAAPGSTVRPLATGLATLGIVGLLLTSGTSGFLGALGGSAGSPVMAPQAAPLDNAAPGGSRDEPLQATVGPTAAPIGAPGNDPGLAATAAPAPLPTAAASADLAGVAGEAPTADPTTERAFASGVSDGDEARGKAAAGDAAPALPLPALASLALLAAGLALLAGRRIAQRRLL